MQHPQSNTQESKRKRVEDKLKDAPMMEISPTGESAWVAYLENKKDPFGAIIVDYAERWARLMQIEMANGASLEDIAESTAHEANLEFVTGFMHSCAIWILSVCWQHGVELWNWHNYKN